MTRASHTACPSCHRCTWFSVKSVTSLFWRRSQEHGEQRTKRKESRSSKGSQAPSPLFTPKVVTPVGKGPSGKGGEGSKQKLGRCKLGEGV